MDAVDRRQQALRLSLNAFFRSFGFSDGQVGPLVARELGAMADDLLDPADAIAFAEHEVGQWFRFVLGSAFVPPEALVAVGRAAFLLCGGAQRWPDAFLQREQLSHELVTALRSAAPLPTPVAIPQAMPEQSVALHSVIGAVWRFLSPEPEPGRWGSP